AESGAQRPRSTTTGTITFTSADDDGPAALVSILNPCSAPKCSPYACPDPPTVGSPAPLACTTCAIRGGGATVAHPLRGGAGVVVAAQQRSGSRHRRPRQLTTLLRAKPSKDGDAELRDSDDASRYVRRAASESTLGRSWRFFLAVTVAGAQHMTFTFKFSQRLARMRPVALILSTTQRMETEQL